MVIILFAHTVHANIIFKGNFETGDYSQWETANSGLNCLNEATQVNVVNVRLRNRYIFWEKYWINRIPEDINAEDNLDILDGHMSNMLSQVTNESEKHQQKADFIYDGWLEARADIVDYLATQ